jgi:hypothetical protein
VLNETIADRLSGAGDPSKQVTLRMMLTAGTPPFKLQVKYVYLWSWVVINKTAKSNLQKKEKRVQIYELIG